MRQRTTMMCEFCEGQVEERVILTSFHYMGVTIYVDGVPARVCRQCGERYFDGAVYERLEAIAKKSGKIKETIQFPLARYSAPRKRAKRTRRSPARAPLSSSRAPNGATVAR